MKKSTEELLKILEQADSPEEYQAAAGSELIRTSLTEELNRLLAERNLKPADVIRTAQLDKSYGYDIFAGKKTPSRDKILAIAFGLSLDGAETQQLLKRTGYAPLYVRDIRDGVILFSLNHRKNLADTNDILFDMQLELVK